MRAILFERWSKKMQRFSVTASMKGHCPLHGMHSATVCCCPDRAFRGRCLDDVWIGHLMQCTYSGKTTKWRPDRSSVNHRGVTVVRTLRMGIVR